MQVENYKINNLVQAVNKIKQTPGLRYSTIYGFATVLKFGEDALKPFFETIKTIQKDHTITDKDGKPAFSEPVKMQEELEAISFQKIDFPMDKFEITIGKEDTRLNLDITKSFIDVFGETFKVIETA